MTSTTTLSCLSHVKRVLDSESQQLIRPPVPPIFTVLELLVDRSGSMQALGSIPTTGTSNFIKKHRELARQTGAKTFFSLTTFDDTATTYLDNIDIATIVQIGNTIGTATKKLELVDILFPRGCTLLVDTMYKRLLALSRKIRSIIAEMPRKVRALKPKIAGVFLTITDGQDNRSERWRDTDLHALVTRQKTKGISVLFLGANQDAIQTAAKFGIQAGHAMTFGTTPQAAEAAFRSATQAAYRCTTVNATDRGATAPPAFTPLERQSSAPIVAHGTGGGTRWSGLGYAPRTPNPRQLRHYPQHAQANFTYPMSPIHSSPTTPRGPPTIPRGPPPPSQPSLTRLPTCSYY